MALADISVADLEALLKQKREAQAAADLETPHSRVLADLTDGRVHPGQLGELLARVLDGFELLGVDLLAEGGPAKVKRAATPKETPAPAGDDTNGGGQ